MRIYRVSIQADKWPSEYNVNAGSWSGATIAALKKFKEDFKRKQVGDKMTIKIIRSGQLITAKENGDEN